MSCLAVDAVERIDRANPQDSLAIFIDAIHHRPTQAVGVAGLVLEFLKKRRTGGKPVGRHHVHARPNVSLAILKQCSHIVLAETIRVRGVITVADELPLLPVKFDQAIPKRPKPQVTFPVLEHRHNPGLERVRKVTLMERIMSERIRLSIEDRQPASCDLENPEHAEAVLIKGGLGKVLQRNVESDLPCIPIERIQAFAGANPEGPRPVFASCSDRVAAQAKGVVWIVTIADGLSARGIESVEPPAGWQPQPPRV